MNVDDLRVAHAVVGADWMPGIDPAKLESLYETPSFIGFSATFQPQGCRMRTVVPIESLKLFVRAGAILMESFEGIDGGVPGQKADDAMDVDPNED